MPPKEEYRERALECVQLAQGVIDPACRATLLEMAAAWLRLADQAEKHSQVGLTYETPPHPPSVPQQQQQQQQRTEPED